MVKLPKAAYNWALKHLVTEGDTDLFPPPFEIEAIRFNWKTVLASLATLDLSNYAWRGYRRFLIPKAELSFRTATQLDPMDSLILAAIMKKYGKKIEEARIPVEKKRVFSNRFAPQPDGRFYGPSSKWQEFWHHSLSRARMSRCKWVAIADITDFYNQIYHHVLQNQLVEAGVPKGVVKAIFNLLKTITHGVSRGIPVGPHSVHLMAECALIPVDRSLLDRGYDFCRYADDMHFFCDSQEHAEIALYDVADVLDAHQRLTLQRQKTKVVSAKDFQSLAQPMLVDRPMNDNEKKIIKVIKKHSDNNPYVFVGLDSLSASDIDTVSDENLTELFDLYLKSTPVNYPRIGWLLRRLAQVGAPGAMDHVLENMNQLMPVLGDVARYLMRASANYEGDLAVAGKRVVRALDLPLIQHSEYMQIILVSLFGMVRDLDNMDELMAMYTSAGPAMRREIIIAAGVAGKGHFIKERKDEFGVSDPWLRQALIAATTSLPGDEARHWVRKMKPGMTAMEKIVARWAFRDKEMKIGEVRVG